jgi:hypothetical protein
VLLRFVERSRKHGAAVGSPLISCTKAYIEDLFPLFILRGPGFHISDFESNRIIGQAQFEATRTVMENSNKTTVSGSVKSVHVYLDM